jgi:4-methoxybenzoate monooxygenase (O-demethylating)
VTLSDVLVRPAPQSDLDPFSDEALADPVPWQTRLRETAPVVHLTRYGC